MCNQNDLLFSKSENKFDHRDFGLEKKLFSFPSCGGPGFPFWMPKGYKLMEIVKNYVNKFQVEVCGIQLVKTPILGKKELYLKTGHLPLYSKNIFSPVSDEKEEYVLRPMTCPHHILLAKEVITGYKKLPFLIGENSLLHRNEYSGGLIGLKRVRAMNLIDTHIFLLPEQSERMIESSLNWIWALLSKFQVDIKEIVLATKSEKEKYLLNSEDWKVSEDILFNCAKKWAKKNKLEEKLTIKSGDAAFYGPKIDFNAVDSLKQNFTISTVQLDISMCKKLDFMVINSDQIQITPWIIHLGLIGTLERFIAYLLEKWKGRFPFWLSPIQIIIIPLDIKFLKESLELSRKLSSKGFRVEVDSSEERINKKIFNSIKERINIQVFIGEKEAKNKDLISFREIGDKENKQLDFFSFINYLQELNREEKFI